MNIKARVEQLERAAPGAGDRRWRETLTRVGVVYGEGPLAESAAVPSPEEFFDLIARTYGEA